MVNDELARALAFFDCFEPEELATIFEDYRRGWAEEKEKPQPVGVGAR